MNKFNDLKTGVVILVLLGGLGLASCGGSGSEQTGTIDVRLTDAPVDNAEAVVIHFIRATLHGPGGNTVIDVYDPVTGDPGRSIDLLQFQSGQWSGFFSQEIAAGNYSWIRLELDLSQSYIQINGAQYALDCTSCSNNGLRLNRSFSIPADGILTLMMDFDLRKSITLPRNGSLVYKLRPTIRIVEADVSGNIAGSVDSTLIDSLGGYTGCYVYVFDGYDAQLDDVYIPFNDAVPAGQNNPVATAPITYSTSYLYNVAFLPSGNYTAAVTCDGENDHADTDDVLGFSTAINTSVTAGQTTTIDFPPPAVP